MGKYLNPGKEMFASVRQGTYVDKSGMLEVINSVMGTQQKLTCITRPRRFGKSYAAKMLCAYYDKTFSRTAGSRTGSLLRDTIEENEQAVAAAIEEAHDSGTAPLFYNDEQALRAVIKVAYISCVDYYVKIEELPSGHGYADVVYLPKKKTSFPAMIIELKRDTTPETALQQIEDHNYPKVLQGYGGTILAVEIVYDAKTKKHSCRIRKVQ